LLLTFSNWSLVIIGINILDTNILKKQEKNDDINQF